MSGYGRVRRLKGESLLAFNRRARSAYVDEGKHEKVLRGEWLSPDAYAASTGRTGASLDRLGGTLFSASQRAAQARTKPRR